MNYYNNAKKNAIVRAVFSVIAVILGVVATLVSYSFLKDENEAVKVLRGIGIGAVTFLLITTIGYGVFTALFKRKVFAVVAVVAGWLGVTLLLIVCSIKWWIVIIIAVALLIVCVLILMGSYSEQLAVVPDNAKPEYKDYKTREAEKQANPPAKEEEELPQIKSFE